MIYIIKYILINSFFLFFSSISNAETEWFHSSGNYQGHRYSKSSQINKNNISSLNQVWVFKSGKIDKRNVVQATPIFIDNKLVIVDIFGGVYALNPSNGKKIWYTKLNPPTGRRGLTSLNIRKPKVYVSTKKSIVELDAKTGKINREFKTGLSLLPPIIDKDILYVATLKEGVKAYSLKNEKQIWNYTLASKKVNPRIWSGFSYDKKTKSLFVVTSNPGGLYGGEREGDDQSVSLISINSKTGKKNWSFQHIRHDLWDFDLVGNPIVFSRINSKNIFERVVVALSKTGDVILLRVNDGKPIFPKGIRKIFVPSSDVKNEKSADFQFKFLKPEPFSGIKVDLKNDFKHLNKEENKKLFKLISNSMSDDYLPPSFNYNLILYGLHGGAEWPGGSLNKNNNNIIVPFNKEPWIIRMEYKDLIFRQIERISKEIFKAKSKLDNSYSYILSLLNFDDIKSEINQKENAQIRNPWEKINKNSKISESLFSLVPFTGLNDFYINNCSACHGIGRQGYYENEFVGDKYVPSLVGLHIKNKSVTRYSNLKKIHNESQIEFEFNEKKIFNTLNEFKNYDQFLYENNLLKIEGFWQNLLDSNGYPASSPPWGGIASVDMNTGDLNWKIPFGKRFNKKQNVFSIGDKNFGGVLSTSSDIFFATGTPDEMARAFLSENGYLIWERKLPFAGSAPPMTYTYKGCQYVVFTATGGQFVGFKNKGDATVAYKLDTCSN